MSGTVRRLALDVSWWVWAYVLLMSAMSILLDTLWLSVPRSGGTPLIAGIFLNLSALQTALKIALWRTLPVTRRQIDLARWLQGVLAPVLWLALMMLGTASILAAAGRLHVAWPSIALMAAAQGGFGVIIFALSITIQAVTLRIDRPAALLHALLLMLLMFAIILVPRLFLGGLLQAALGSLALTGFMIALLLYAMAGHWPVPPPGWASFWSAHPSSSSKKMAPGFSGWPALIMAQAPAILLCWCLIPGMPLFMRLALGMHDADISFMAQMGLLFAGVLPATNLAGVIRALRALPLTGLSLTLRLVALLVAIQIAGAAIYFLTLVWLQPEFSYRPTYMLLPVALPVMLFALALRFGPGVAQFSAAIAIFFASLGALFLRYLDVSVAGTALLVVVLIGLGIAAAYREIRSGRHAYRAQPLVPLSWRGG